jgi:hypothetical protein
VAAALLTLIVSSTPSHGVLAARPALADPAPTGEILHDSDAPSPASASAPRPFSSRATAALDFRTFDLLATVPVDAWALATMASEPEPTAPAPAAATPAQTAPAPATAAPATAAPAKAAPARPAPPRVVRAAARPARLWAQLRHGLTVTGKATWYFGTRGYAGIAHVAMPGARYLTRGRSAPRARVCAGGRCTIVRVVDACGCSVGSRRARVADLSATTLRRLGLDPRHGVYRIRVTLLAP